jgi:glycosyltransferase involved in cell wall biosynthesis
MRIVLDLQGAQTQSRFRGIGRYSLSFALALARNAGEHELWLVLNGAFPEVILDIRRGFKGLVPNERIRVFEAPTPVVGNDPANALRARAAKPIREHFLQQLKPDLVVVTSLFEGYVDDAVTSVGAFVPGERTAVILYDLIPLFDPERYLPTRPLQYYYHRKIQFLKNAGLLLAISDASRLEGLQALGIPTDDIVTISTAVDDNFGHMDFTEEERGQLLDRYGIKRKMVLYAPGGFDVRKNFPGLIKAYSLLSDELRSEHQLVIVSRVEEKSRVRLMEEARLAGLASDELVLTGYVSDEDLVAFYNLAVLFVFPSKHEGFGLPVLEAMTCGTPTIGSNTTSVPEVIGCEEALFDPASPQSMAEKITRVLQDEHWQEELRQHAVRQAKKFSWDESAKKAMAALECHHLKLQQTAPLSADPSAEKKKLAFLSPLPPERSGISDYSAELLPELAKLYEIELIVAQNQVSDSYCNASFPIRTIEWFKQHSSKYDRILYQFGNSPFHSHMLDLLPAYPGVVVLHDFFLSGMLAYEELTGKAPGIWTESLYYSHGYWAVKQKMSEKGSEKAKNKYPCNLQVLQDALGVVVHSQFSRHLANKWYDPSAADDWAVIPLLRVPVQKTDRARARTLLNLDDKDFVVCSFGLINPAKLNHRLLDAWLASDLAKDKNCILVFVGENHHGDYGNALKKTINKSGLKQRIRITGWADADTFSNYLTAADLGVQLRTMSRGETSAAVLDCMNHGLATIVNANGSMDELSDHAVMKLPDWFEVKELVKALETLFKDGAKREALGRCAREVILTNHDPKACARRYEAAIESVYEKAATGRRALINALVRQEGFSHDEEDLERIAISLAASSRPSVGQRQLLVDVSTIVQNDLKTGIERVVGAQLLELIKNVLPGFRVEPVYLTNGGGHCHYRYARAYTAGLLGIESFGLPDEAIDVAAGDIFYGLDFCQGAVADAQEAGIYTRWKTLGVSINFAVFDLLPVLHPEFFPQGADEPHAVWLDTIAALSDGLICISSAVAADLTAWISSRETENRPLISAVHLGADIANARPSMGMPDNAREVLATLDSVQGFLMVGTIEPRKGHLQAIAAFEKLWEQGVNATLVIVGKEGWGPLPDNRRRTIPKIVNKLGNHPELNKRLFWLEGISDEYLEKIYAASTCLIAASEGEGFGLPLIEAAQYKLPIIARDLPVFREVAGDNAFYFEGLAPESLAQAIRTWSALNAQAQAPGSDKMPWLTWEQSALQLIKVILP